MSLYINILRGFEVISSLCVNLSETKIFGVNLKDDFLAASSSFISCDRENLPFRFLRVSVSMNPRRNEVQCSILDKIKRRVAYWKGGQFSMEGRIVMIINSYALITWLILKYISILSENIFFK